MFVAYAQANQAAGLSYNHAARVEFLAGGTEGNLQLLEQQYGIQLIQDVTLQEINAAAARLQAAFGGDPLQRVLRDDDARVASTVFLKNETLATGDLQFFKRASDLGLSVEFVGTGSAAARAAAYVPRPVVIPRPEVWHMTTQTAHEELLRSVLKRPLTEEDALLWMVLLHTHAIHLRPNALAGDHGNNSASEVLVLHPETQRGAAGVIAALWPDRTDERANYAYWYWQYNTHTPYEVLSDVPGELMPRLLELRHTLAREPRVTAVVEED